MSLKSICVRHPMKHTNNCRSVLCTKCELHFHKRYKSNRIYDSALCLAENAKFYTTTITSCGRIEQRKKNGRNEKKNCFFLFNHWFDFSTKADIMMLPTKTIKSTITIHQKKMHENRIKCSECKPFNFHSLLLNERVSMNLSSVLAIQYQHFCCAPFRCKAHSFTWIGCETTANRLLFIGKVSLSSSTRGFLVRCKIFVRCWTSLKWIHLHGFNISIWMHQIT